ncbi:MAG TPA: hypothetical protein DEO84_08000 [candidate division Zixibacteria bacterium]|nr:hypothetical protein [candidate division Zixibacteria bacterium]
MSDEIDNLMLLNLFNNQLSLRSLISTKRVGLIIVLMLLLFPKAMAFMDSPGARLVPMEVMGAFGPGHMGWRHFGQYCKLLSPGTLRGGALVKLDKPTGDQYIYIFCDPDLSRLLLFREEQIVGRRRPIDIREYGRFITYHGYPELTPGADASKFILGTPADVVVTSCGSYYDPDKDFIFVLDRGNHKVIKFRYDLATDSLTMVESFGENILHDPASIEYADKNDSDPTNDKIFVTDFEPYSVIRFSRDGQLETSFMFGNWSHSEVIAPSGIAASYRKENKIYICDYGSKNFHGNGIVAELSALDSIRLLDSRTAPTQRHPSPKLTALDTDWHGNIYVADYPLNSIVVFSDSMFLFYQNIGPEQLGRLFYPSDIYIDGDEMQVCEMWAESTGIASYKIIPDSTRPEQAPIPRRYYLHFPHPLEFSTQTKLSFDICKTEKVQLKIVDESGRTVKMLVDDVLPAGTNAVIWNAQNDHGQPTTPGIYYCKMIAAEYEATKKIIYAK